VRGARWITDDDARQGPNQKNVFWNA